MCSVWQEAWMDYTQSRVQALSNTESAIGGCGRMGAHPKVEEAGKGEGQWHIHKPLKTDCVSLRGN